MKKGEILREKIELAAFLVYPIVASVISFLFETNFLFSLIIFYGFPALYLSWRLKSAAANSYIVSLFSVPIVIIIDYVAHVNKAWTASTVFPFRLFGQVPLEDIFLGIILVYFGSLFYEYFLDKHITHRLFHRHVKYVLIGLLSLFSIFLLLVFSQPTIFHIPYIYTFVGIIFFLIPAILDWFKFPKYLTKFIKTQAYFFYFHFIYEITALKLGWWSFPGTEFLGWVIIGNISFPLEEFFFWIMLSALGFLGFFEYVEVEKKK